MKYIQGSTYGMNETMRPTSCIIVSFHVNDLYSKICIIFWLGTKARNE